MNGDLAKVREQAHYWLVLQRDNSLSGELKSDFSAWLNAKPEHVSAYAEAELLYHALNDETVKEELSTLSKPVPKTSLSDMLHAALSKLTRPAGLIFSGSLAAILVVMNTFLSPTTEQPVPPTSPAALWYQAAVGQGKIVTLADNSTVNLAAGSQISVVFSAQQRLITLLHGSAFFDVTHNPDRPFIVSSGSVDIRVTGTEFDVQRKNNSVYVAVQSGSVGVAQPIPDWQERNDAKQQKPWHKSTSGMKKTVSLKAGETVTASRTTGLGQVEKVNQVMLGAWRNGKLIYINKPLVEIVEDMNRHWHTRIKLDAKISDLKLSGTFNSDDIAGMLEAIEAALPIVVVDQPEGVLIKAS